MRNRLTLLFFTIILINTFTLNSCRNADVNMFTPRVHRGVIDLRNWDFHKDGIVNLSGQWEFCWQKQIEPAEDSASGSALEFGFIKVPGIWNNYIQNGNKISGHGYATYRLKILLSHKHKKERLALKLLDMATAFRLYINAKPLVSSGSPGKTADTTIPRLHPVVAEFEPESNQIDIIVHVSNFHHWQGGMWESVLLGSAHELKTVRERRLVFNFILFGSILIMGLYHFGLYWFRRNDKSTLYFGLFCILISARILTTGERYILHIVPNIDYEIMQKIVYCSFYLCVPFFAMFLKSLFPLEISGKIISIIKVMGIVFSIFVLLVPAQIYTYTMPAFQLFTLLLLTYGLWTVSLSVNRNREGAIVFLIGFLFLFITAINDILYTRQIINTGHYSQLGFFIFIFSQAILISQRFSGAFATIEKQGHELRSANAIYKTEIEHRKQAEDSLWEREEMFRSLFEYSNDAIILHDLNGNIIDFNQRTIETLGYDHEQLLNISIADLHPEEELETSKKAFRETIDKGYTRFESQFKTSDGTLLAVEVSSRVVDMEGKGIVQGIIRDISQRNRAENSLKKERDKAQQYLDIAGVIFIALDKDQNVTLVNKKGCEILGYEEHEIIGKNWFDHFIKAEDTEEIKGVFNQIISGNIESVEYYENAVIKKGGDYRIIAWHNSIIRDESGHIIGLLSSGEDITEKKLTENNLKESEEKFRLITESSAETIWQLDLKGKVTYTSPTVEKVFGYTPEEALLLNFNAFFQESELSKAAEAFSKVFSGEEYQVLEFSGRRKDGSSVPIEVSVIPILKDETIVGVQGIARDITERKDAEKALRESEETLEAILAASPVGIGFAQDRIIKWGNKTLYNMLSYEEGSLKGKNVRVIYPDDEEYERVGRKLYSAGQVECRWVSKDGRVFDCHLQVSPINTSDLSKGIIIAAIDITDRKGIEEQLRQSQKMEAVGTLAGGVAHDFNNILTSILGNSDLALMEISKDDPSRKDIEEIRKAGERAASLTRQLLAFSRKQIIQPEVLDINELLIDVKKMLDHMIKEDIKMKLILEPSLWNVEMDPGQMEQVIMNLVVNAGDAMPNGGMLTIETANVDIDENYFHEHGVKGEPGSHMMLAVSDTGIGMDKETQEHIFEPFYTTKGKEKGTGLGLSTIYGIVKQNNGFVWVYSEPGQGSTFKVYLPTVKEDIKPQEKVKIPEADLNGSETVLIVEDDDSLRNLVQTVLHKYGYRILVAENGEEALRVSKKHKGPIQLILTDVVMPGMSGREAAEKLQPLYPQMKVIYMSGYTDNAIAHHGVLDPGLNFIEKPFILKDLAKKVREVLDNE